jgi:hypothetical protein
MALAYPQVGGGRGMISVERFRPEDEADIREFNARIAANDGGFTFPTHPRELGVPASAGARLWTEMWVARDELAVRGGFLLKHERLLNNGSEVPVGNFQLPLSEGIVDRRFAMVGLSLLQRASKESTALYSLGMGSLSRPLPRLLARRGWLVEEVPFFFRVIRGTRFAKNLRTLQTSPKHRSLMRLARVTGAAAIGAMAWRAAARAARLKACLRQSLRFVAVRSFDERVDRIAYSCRPSYTALLDRSSEALNVKFPAGDERLHRFLVEARGEPIGWLVLGFSRLQDHKQFGALKLGSIVDGLVEPSWLELAIAISAKKLTAMGADLIVSNQSHKTWQRALSRNLFARGPTNFIFARSPGFAIGIPLHELHINRGDGDGPINL